MIDESGCCGSIAPPQDHLTGEAEPKRAGSFGPVLRAGNGNPIPAL